MVERNRIDGTRALVSLVLVLLGAIVIIKPEIIAWVLGAYLILSGVMHMIKD